MRKLLSTLALAALMAGLATGAQATEGWYVRGDVGYSVDSEVDLSQTYDDEDLELARAAAAVEDYTVDYSYDLDNDWMGALGAGYAFKNGFRLEGELAYRTNDVDYDAYEYSGDTSVESTSAMINLFYDFNRDGRFQPYLGVGVGAAKVEIEDYDDTSFAYQGLAGVGVVLSPRWTLDVGYRYFAADDLEYDVDYYAPVEAEYTHQAVTVGLRYQLSAPAAAPVAPVVVAPPVTPVAPVVVACPTSEFVVYFEWDRSNLNDAALETIDQAVTRARECNVAGTIVIGHTDTSGSTQYNEGLSQRRAAVVRDALVARGLDAGSIALQAHGERDLARATPDGVREPLNRRTAVTITFQ
jgi:outer membrane protein OmpA-like peptidoglycan-associated protein